MGAIAGALINDDGYGDGSEEDEEVVVGAETGAGARAIVPEGAVVVAPEGVVATGE